MVLKGELTTNSITSLSGYRSQEGSVELLSLKRQLVAMHTIEKIQLENLSKDGTKGS